MGKTYTQHGVNQSLAVMHDLVANPATANHIAVKLARHFVADDPPQALVDRLQSTPSPPTAAIPPWSPRP